MRWEFCREECCQRWHELRHDSDVKAWLRIAKGVRAKLLSNEGDAAPYEGQAEAQRAKRGVPNLRAALTTLPVRLSDLQKALVAPAHGGLELLV